jgi:steroid 5-alpha reductase family enzyme
VSREDRAALLAIPVTVSTGVGMAFAGSHGGAALQGIPLFALAVTLAFVVQWVAFVPAYALQTERFFDLTGSATYVGVTVLAVLFSPAVDGRSILVLALVVIWAARLGTFLFRRVHRAGKDRRFDAIKPSFARFLMTWTLQGLWVTLTLAPALVVITTATRRGLGPFALIGLLVWTFGFAFEVIADAQKSGFRRNPANSGGFIRTGLWARSRHPNYFGEIVLWIGMAVIALPVLRGWQWISLISPVFVAVLLTRVSGVPMLEQRADEQWGGQAEYETYKAHTPVLIPRL